MRTTSPCYLFPHVQFLAEVAGWMGWNGGSDRMGIMSCARLEYLFTRCLRGAP